MEISFDETRNRSFVFQYLIIGLAALSLGCAAPMTEISASRPTDEIDQRQFKKGDEVWVDYQVTPYESGKRTLRGFVLETNDKSVKLDIGRGRYVDIKYRTIRTLSRPVSDRWYLGFSGGPLDLPVPVPQELPKFQRLGGLGVALRLETFRNSGFECNLSGGRQGSGRFASWINLHCNGHFGIIVPETYIYVGFGQILSFPDKEYREYHYSMSPRFQRFLPFIRIGFGVTADITKKSRVRFEGGLFDLRISFDRKIN